MTRDEAIRIFNEAANPSSFSTAAWIDRFVALGLLQVSDEKEPVAATIGERVAIARGRLGLTQAALGSALNISSQAVSQWERGESSPDVAKLPALADELGISLDDLLRNR